MKQANLRILLITLIMLVMVTGVHSAEQRTLTGRYTSGYQDGDKPVRAVFTPGGDGIWNVNFYFNFNGRDHVYGGTAVGSLSEGVLEGDVMNESQRRTFVFRGDFEEGKFSGRHAEIKRGGERQTGTIQLSE